MIENSIAIGSLFSIQCSTREKKTQSRHYRQFLFVKSFFFAFSDLIQCFSIDYRYEQSNDIVIDDIYLTSVRKMFSRHLLFTKTSN
jgi:hypothetical protein